MLALRILSVLAIASAASAQADSDGRDVRTCVLPTPLERLAETIPWRTTFRDAALEADASDRPILLWAMNGHPLGCT